jgi:hypothetical protein
MITIVKFIENENKGSSNSVISKTLGKYGVFNNRDGSLPPEQIPSPGEFWRVEVVKEIITRKKSGNAGGCFLLKPLSKVGHMDSGKPDITYLVPGGYEASHFQMSLVIVPKPLGFNWILDLDLRHHLRDQYHNDGVYKLNSFVVSLDGSTKWPIEESSEEGTPPSPDASPDSNTIYSPETD